MEKVKSVMDKTIASTCAILLAFMTLLTIYQVIMRYAFKSPSTVSEELLGYSFVWVSLLGTALVFGQKDHMKITLLSDKVKGKGQVVLSVFTELLIMAIAIGVFILGGQRFMEIGSLQLSPTINIEMHWIYIIIPICGVLIMVYNILNIIQDIQKNYKSRRGELQ
ncbi:TRAP transporter small permease [Cytobacillus kochii]|uniref:C4-dicarboxylate ABC transporter permease n=1 Tax=Cytobacillus kochii TaxID=859143 RepID=A0A248TG84_9BACI|nr:TRAP transporter small permease [Cytobacillus kochii]ASV67208.1 C4-dicarboxylate ABC transporter permease [Cytobacillus kochii]